jgi:dinuclear metal center YbgI/SA1388 family protein
MTATVAQLTGILDRLAPPRLAAAWDNVGLQVGSRNWPVNKVWTALDPLPEVVAAACETGVDLLVTHHPLFFKPVKRIDCASALGRVVEMAVSRQLAIFCAHTNLDSVAGGLNDVLAQRMELQRIRVLDEPTDRHQCKLVVFAPATHVKVILDTLFELDAGRIGNYSCCSFRSEGVGTFLPGDGARPAVGQTGALSEVQEHRIEIVVNPDSLHGLIDALRQVHPYETMAFDVYPLAGRDQINGLGRVGRLAAAIPLNALSKKLKTAFNLDTVKIVGRGDMPVENVAVCTGSGSSLLQAAIAAGAQAYVSGDLGYHTARDAQQAGIGLIDIGHFGSEHIIVDVLAASMREAIAAAGLSVVVEASEMETDPFHYL